MCSVVKRAEDHGTFCSPCIWCANIYAQIRADESHFDFLWPRKGSQSSGYDKNYHKTGSNDLKNKFYQKFTFLIKRDTDRLRSSEGNFYVHKIFGDGNCMYRSISYIIWGDEDEHRSLRTMVVEHINDNWWDYSAFVMAEWNISSKEEYYDYMIKNGTYATELECVVATKLYQMNLSIYREIEDTKKLERIFHNRVNKNYRTARLLFSGRTDNGHYDVLIPD